MHLNHHTAFADFSPVPTPAPAFAPGTMFETPKGWRPVEALQAGDHVATLDGGFRPLEAVTRRGAAPGPAWHIPGGTLGTCSDLILPGTHHLALRHAACRRLFGLPMVLAPVSALTGYDGVRRVIAPGSETYALSLADEEVLWAQTGAALHVPAASGSSHYQRLDYGQTRALLLMMADGFCAPDLAA